MFYFLSKWFWLIAEPTSVLGLIACLGLLLTYTRWLRLGRFLLAAALSVVVLISVTPISEFMLSTLESRFPEWRDDGKGLDGIIVLGGAIDPYLYGQHHGSGFNDAIGRITETALLARRFKNAKIIIAAGNLDPHATTPTEAQTSRELLLAFGVEESRIFLDTSSRNTFENAVFSKQIAQPKPGERWLVVTSAFHMARAIGCFRAVGFPVIAYPVDYRVAHPFYQFSFNANGLKRLTFVSLAIHEIVGLAAYRLTNRIPEFYPAPQPETGDISAR